MNVFSFQINRQAFAGPVSILSLAGAVYIAAALLSGCASPERRLPVPFSDAPDFSSAGDRSLESDWWHAFNDDALSERVEFALSQNLTLAEAWERLRAASALVDVERSSLFPQLDGVAGGSVREGGDVDRSTELRLGLRASYEVDLWGRVRASVEAERLRAAATAADLQAVGISVSAEIALTWYQLAEALLQLGLVESQLDTNQRVLQVLEKRFAVGQGSSADVLRQRQLVESTHEQSVVIESGAALLRHRLAVLEGRVPQENFEFMPIGLPRIPDWPETGLPSELLQRRPDVRAAFLRLEAADRDVAEAVRDQYPRIDLAGALETAGENPSGLFDDWLASLAFELIAPLYDGGRRRAEVEQRVALRRVSLAQYGQAVLTAFREVEDAIAQERFQIERIARLKEQIRLSEATYDQLRTQYLNGAADFIDVLISLREQQQLERDVLTAQLDRVRFRIALYRALAGGFELPEQEWTRIQESAPYEESTETRSENE